MSQTVKPLDFQEFTLLPCVTYLQANGTGGAVRVNTPHKGEVILDLRYDGMLNIYDHLTTKIIREIRTLENEARDFLLNEWLKEKVESAA